MDSATVEPAIVELDPGSAADRISRHLGALIAGAIDADDPEDRAKKAVDLADAIARALVARGADAGVLLDVPLQPPRALRTILPCCPWPK